MTSPHIPILTTVEQVAQLWTCKDFVPAFHFIYGWQGSDKQKFKSIMRGGHLKTASEVGNESMFIYDVMAGDDQLVFLSTIRTPRGMGGGSRYGLIFDAHELIDKGALFGSGDLLSEYDEAAHGVFSKYYMSGDAHTVTVYGHQKNTIEDRNRFFNYQPRWGYRDEPPPVNTLVPELIEAFVALANTRVLGPEAHQLLDGWSTATCQTTRMLLDMARNNMVANEDKFTRHRAVYEAHMADWDDYKRCYVAARDSVAGDKAYYDLVLASSPEIMWRGRLPLSLAHSAFALSSDEHISWPDDLFRLACV
jgi:hypothetical protein